jgi:regulator of replication initiation timing
MYNKKSIFENEDVSKFSPLLQFFYYDLSIDEINQIISKIDKNRRRKLNDENVKSRLDEVKSYVVKALDDAVNEFHEVLRKSSKNLSPGHENDFARLNQAQVNFSDF